MSKKQKDPYEEAQEKGTTLEDFIIPQRIDAFAEAYTPSQEAHADETFSETRLRNFFKAWPTSLGDPLSLYLERLADKGYRLTVSTTGDLCIFVTLKNVYSSVLDNAKRLALIDAEKNIEECV